MREHVKTTFARQLRRDMKNAKRHLWSHLRRRQLAGFRFRRQHPLGDYIADFVCVEKGVVEADGSQHLDSARDGRRYAWLQAQGFTVVRCWNHDVLDRTERVLGMILEALEGLGPQPSSSAQRA